MVNRANVIYYHDMKIKKIERLLCAYLGGWERLLSASRVADMLGVSREHASRKVITWARKSFRTSKEEGLRKAVFIEDELSAMPQGLQTPRDLITNLPGLALACDYFERPQIERLADYLSGEGDPDIFRELFAAMRRQEALLLCYKAKSGDFFLWFSPHTLVDLPHRPHFRGHARWIRDGDCAYIDLIPSRIVSVGDRSTAAYTGLAEDIAWRTKCEISLRLADDLPPTIRAAMVQEWGYQLRSLDGHLVLTLKGVRLPLVQYVKDAIFWRTFLGTSYQVWQENVPKPRSDFSKLRDTTL
jgi:hypothetical protein